MQSAPDPSQGFAHVLADTGVLPMYGMPSSVRNLFYHLPSSSDDDQQPKSLDRDLGHAVTEFAPDNELVWDKKLLKPSGLVGPILKEVRSRNNWRATESAVSGISRQTFCINCRRFKSDLIAIEELGEPDSTETCDTCKLLTSNTYDAVTPNGFMTDFNISRSSKEESYINGISSFMGSPSISEKKQKKEGRALLALSLIHI